MRKVLYGLLLAGCFAVTFVPSAFAIDNSISVAQDDVTSGECGANVTWTLSENGVLTVCGNGAMEYYEKDTFPWVKYQLNIQKVIVNDGVTSISDNAFQECINLTDVILADSVEKIGAHAFYRCENLVNVSFGKNLNEIGSGAFQKCINLKEVDIPDGVSELGDSIFRECKKLSRITLPKEINTIPYYSFFECSNLEYVTIPEGVVSIGGSAFAYSKNLKEITIPKNVNEIDQLAFYGCESLTSIDVNEENIAYQSRDGVLLDKQGVTLISYPANNSKNMYRMPNTVKKIADHAFYKGKNLENIQLSDNLISISDDAFHVMQKLTRITIPESVKSIGKEAFAWNSNLRMIRFLGDAPDIGELCFSSNTLTVYYPANNSTWTKSIMKTYNGHDIGWETWSISKIFFDVKDTDWFSPYVEYSFEKNMMGGTGNGRFEPYTHLSRAMAVQILYARAGSPDISTSPRFSDVESGSWYFKAIQWASENNIVSGVGNGKFAPNADVTREQLAVILYASQDKPESAVSLDRFADSNKVSNWAKDAVGWAVDCEIIRGSKKNGRLYVNPEGYATRAEAATMLTQYDKKFNYTQNTAVS